MASLKLTEHQPREMYLLALTEMCQRFAFWGVGNLLVLYLVQYHHFSDTTAENLFGIFTGVSFALPILGGYVADKLNYRMPVVWGMLLTALGCFLIYTGSIPLTFAALGLIAIGGAIFTPSIYTILGNLYHQKHHLRDSGFSIYYASVNIGVFLAMIILGSFGQAHHWNSAFLFAGCIQLLGIWPFLTAYKNVQIKKAPSASKADKKLSQAPLHPHEKQRIWVIVILTLFSTIFWMAYNQGGSSLNLFALRFTDRQIGNFEIPPTWLLSFESLYLVLLAIPLSKFYFYLTRKQCEPSPPMKMAWGLFAMTLCFLIMSLGSSHIPPQAKSASISPYFPIAAYGFMALGEMLICPIGLSMITHISPRKYTAMLVGVWYFCIGLGFYLGGIVAPLMTGLKTISGFFNLFVVITLLCGLILYKLSKKLNQMRKLDSL